MVVYGLEGELPLYFLEVYGPVLYPMQIVPIYKGVGVLVWPLAGYQWLAEEIGW
ncbi:40866_t:CDS:2 [Gigaspora margarita]|uniref:40866_t:CDS:1 n=1 Tax=Gigaspora margarita TaxID=4874 RepID=A0ABN7UC72_GIGMA|nr:40866_t:CDS:2 [Gigaspora margarita]